MIAFDPALALSEALLQAAASTDVFDDSFEPQVRPADPRFGDFQANGVLPWAKRNRTNPRAAATSLLEAFDADAVFGPGMVAVEIAGPGFLNFTLSPDFLLNWLQTYASAESVRDGLREQTPKEEVLIDFSSPNTAKAMHVGHIRTTIIGECLARLLKFFGAGVTTDNHIGDWGTQFGILITQIKETGFDLNAPSDDPLADIEQLYKDGAARFKEDDAVKTRARNELVKLQDGDAENLALWRRINELSQASFQAIYDRLDVHFDLTHGESFYRDHVERIYDELTATGVGEDSDGALVVFHSEHKRFAKQPFIIRKSDGASNYGTTDLATVLHRTEMLGANRLVYVVDSRQSDHFEQLFLTVEKWYKAKDRAVPDMTHVSFGTILGNDGRAIKTRDGSPPKLADLLDEAVTRAAAVVAEKSPDLSAEEQAEVARVVGLGAVRYSDLMQNRTSDYQFSWPKMLSMEGNTAPYLLYAVARIHSIFRKAGLAPTALDATAATPLETDEEKALARKLLGFVTALQATRNDLRPHLLCTYLYELAGTFSTFYNNNKVLTENPGEQTRRLLLAANTLTTLKTGLNLLGLRTLERM